jgi:enoyl-CoA hydratase/carnithine racemase
VADSSNSLALVSRHPGNAAIAIVTLNNPSRRNAFSPAMKDELIDAFDMLQQDASCRAIVLTGAGDVFCSGADLKQLGSTSLIGNRRRMDRSSILLRLMVAGPKPVVAAVEGPAIGAGLALAAACDYVVSASNARLACTFVRVGVHPDNGALWSIQRRVGLAKAGELVLLCDEVDGNEAVRIGLANRVSEPGKTLEVALEVAGRYAAMPPLAMAMTKATLAKAATDFETCLQAERDLMPVLMATKDHAEAVAAFIEKRKPVFTGT